MVFLIPTLIIPEITDLSPAQLQALGIEGLIFDLDNTLMAPKTGILEARIQQWLESLTQAGLRYVVVSNNKRHHYIQEAAVMLNIPVIGHARKPSRKKLNEAVALLALAPHQVAVVGDRPLTDIWGGVRIGALTILVDPLTKHTEPNHIKVLRRMERWFVRPTQP